MFFQNQVISIQLTFSVTDGTVIEDLELAAGNIQVVVVVLADHTVDRHLHGNHLAVDNFRRVAFVEKFRIRPVLGVPLCTAPTPS